MTTAVSSCHSRLSVSLRRKKSALLGVSLVTVAVVLCLQYSVARDSIDDPSQQPVSGYGSPLMGEKQPLRSNQLEETRPVQFIANSGNSVATELLNDQPQSQFNRDNYPPVYQPRESIQIHGGYPAPSRKQIYVPPQRIVHFDLKGAPPKVSYIKQVLSLVKSLGATGVLLEWEDMFPYKGAIKELAASNAYSKEEVKEIINYCREKRLSVIPLIQTFGHVEFALKYETFSSLREVPESPQALCPSLNESLVLIEHMVQQVLAVHGSVPYLHVGCDEVFQLGECPRCRPKVRDELFLSHVANVAHIVKKVSPNTIPLIWDDMLRHIPAPTLLEWKMNTLVEPMVWVYAEDIYRFVPSNTWEKLAAVFPYVWTASAFKGAFGEVMYVPNAKRHLENNLNWLELMNNEGPLFKGGFRAIVITGWQRYDHFATLCELLPGAIPSLALTTLACSRGYFNNSLVPTLVSSLGCTLMPPTSISLQTDMFLWDALGRCTFPGHGFFAFLQRLNSLQREVDGFFVQVEKKRSWLTPYNVRHNFSSAFRIDDILQEQPRLYHSVISLVHAAIENLQPVFDNYTVAEWIEQNIYPMLQRLEKVGAEGASLKLRKVWQRRPFPILKDLERFGLIKGEPTERNQLVPMNRPPG